MTPHALPVDGGARLWTIDLDRETDTSSLSDEERTRADRLVRARDRRRFAAGRAALRTILASHLGSRPDAMAFAYGEHGKPSLDRARMGLVDAPHFNVAHSGALAMIALSRQPLGIDVERVDRDIDPIAMAGVVFAADEIAALRGLPASRRIAAFYKVWTSREALAKASGLGLAVAREAFVVCAEPHLPPGLLRGGDGWRLEPVAAPEGYAAALAVAADAGPTQPGSTSL